MKEYKILIDQQVVDEYNEVYSKVHPRSKKKAIERPIPPGLNQLLVMTKFQRNYYKGLWKDFGMWLIKKLDYDNLKLDYFEMEVTVYMPSRRRFDIDNQCGSATKLLADSFTESGFIIDDNNNVLTKLTMTGGYDKENPRVEFLLKTIEKEKTNE